MTGRTADIATAAAVALLVGLNLGACAERSGIIGDIPAHPITKRDSTMWMYGSIEGHGRIDMRPMKWTVAADSVGRWEPR